MRKLLMRNLVSSGRTLRSRLNEPTSSTPATFLPGGPTSLSAAKFSSVAPTSRTILNFARHQYHPLSQRPALNRRLATTVATASSSSSQPRLESIRRRRSALFDAEAERQQSLASARLQKIKIEYETEDSNKIEMWMNKGTSTPHDCALHLKTLLVRRSVVALVNGEPWDMFRPLTSDASLRLFHFRNDADAHMCNAAFWRSCSFALGSVLETAFRGEVAAHLRLCSFPAPNLETGSFCYDVDLGEELRDWKPSAEELKCLSAQVGRMHWEDIPFERLEVSASVAKDIFRDDEFKYLQIPAIVEKSRLKKAAAVDAEAKEGEPVPYYPDGTVTCYRLADHVDISSGPMIPSTRFFQPGRFTITAVHPISSPSYGPLHRVQGVALPAGMPLHSYSYRILTKNATRLNTSPLPHINKSPSIPQIPA